MAPDSVLSQKKGENNEWVNISWRLRCKAAATVHDMLHTANGARSFRAPLTGV
jgi:hypothetical protein